MLTQYNIKYTEDISKIIGIEHYQLKEILSNIENEYTHTKIQKKSGGFRTISIPSSRLEYCQRFFLELLQNEKISECSHGYVKGKNIKTNILEHINSNFMLSIDIKSFFESFTVSCIHTYFCKLGFNPRASYIIAKILTLKGSLPQGSCCSPLLSNILFLEIDNTIKELSFNHDIIYTRYVDDFTFSSKNNISSDFYNKVIRILRNNGFKLNNKKTRFYDIKFYMEINSIKIFNNNGTRELKVRRSYYKNIKSELYFIKKYGLKSHNKYIKNTTNYNKDRILGKILYVRMFDYEKGEFLLNEYNFIFQ